MSGDDTNPTDPAGGGPEEREVGYDPTVERGADPHDPTLGGDAENRSWRRLGSELTSARDVHNLVGTIRRYGWAPPLLGLLVHGGARGVFEHLSEPFAMSQRYIFEGWQVAFGINLLFGFFLSAFSWFLFFGVIGSFAGFFSTTTKMETATLKAGGYLMVLFVPLLAVCSALAVTIPPPDAVVAGVDSAEAVASTHQEIAETPQMRIVDTLLAAGWIIVGFLMIPVVSELYGISRKASVASVLPVTLIAVVATQLV